MELSPRSWSVGAGYSRPLRMQGNCRICAAPGHRAGYWLRVARQSGSGVCRSKGENLGPGEPRTRRPVQPRRFLASANHVSGRRDDGKPDARTPAGPRRRQVAEGAARLPHTQEPHRQITRARGDPNCPRAGAAGSRGPARFRRTTRNTPATTGRGGKR